MKIINKSYKFRIYPNKEQEIQLKRTLGCCRFIYNFFLKKVSSQERDTKNIFKFKELSKDLTQLKQDPNYYWLRDVSAVALQQSLRNFDTAFVNFFAHKSKFPKTKKRKNGGSARFAGSGFSLKESKLKIGRVDGLIKVKWSSELPSKPLSCTISLNSMNQWHVSFPCKEEINQDSKPKNKTGIDLGIETFATLSDGQKINPVNLSKLYKKASRIQKENSRKKTGSKNKTKSNIKVAKVYGKIINSRKDFLNKLSTQLISENQTIIIEDLSVERISKKSKWAGLIYQQGWHSFRRMLEYKAEWYDRELIVINRFTPTSQTCNACGKTNKVSLDKRTVTCECGVTYDRDINAAQNILAAGMAVSACGVDVRPVLNGQLTMKQEAFLKEAIQWQTKASQD